MFDSLKFRGGEHLPPTVTLCHRATSIWLCVCFILQITGWN